MQLVRRLWFFAATWVCLAALWLLLVDTTYFPELAAGAACATLAAVGSELVRAERPARVRPRPGWLLRAWRPLARAPVDVGVLALEAVRQLARPRRRRGRVRAIRFRGTGPDAVANAGRALAEGLGSFAPNTVVIGVDERRNVLLAHQLRRTDPVERSLDPLELR